MPQIEFRPRSLEANPQLRATAKMFKLFLIATLAIAGACAQLAPTQEAAPEPYAYEYSTDTHGAAEQRGPDGRVTGYYTLVDADGRSRRVEYVADEAGFRAKVQTNEVGTKNENTADVEVQASPPTPEQLAQTNVVSQQTAAYGQQRVSYAQQPVSQVQKSVSYVSQPYGYATGYSSGYNGYYTQPGAYYSSNVNGLYGNGLYGYGFGYGAPSGSYYKQLAPASYYGSYYNQAPAAYRTVSTVSGVPAQAYSYRAGYQTVGVPTTSSVSYQTVGVPTGGVRYQTVGAPVASAVRYQTVGVPATSGVSYQTVGAPAQSGVFRSATYRSVSGPSAVSDLQSSGNYLLLKKRDAEETKKSSA